MAKNVWRAACYLAFFGLIPLLFAREEATARHGRRSFAIFIGEVLAFVLADIARIRLKLSAVAVFVPLVAAVALAKVFLIFRLLTSRDGDLPASAFFPLIERR